MFYTTCSRILNGTVRAPCISISYNSAEFIVVAPRTLSRNIQVITPMNRWRGSREKINKKITSTRIAACGGITVISISFRTFVLLVRYVVLFRILLLLLLLLLSATQRRIVWPYVIVCVCFWAPPITERDAEKLRQSSTFTCMRGECVPVHQSSKGLNYLFYTYSLALDSN